MDSLTQLQNYVASIGSFMTDSLHAAWNEAGALTAEQVRQADRERRAALANPEPPPVPASSPTAAADGSAGGGAEGDVLVVNGVLIPSLNAPLYSGLPPSVEFHMADRAHQLFKRVLEADALMQALPPVHHPEHDLQAQVERIKFLEAHGEKAAHQLKEAQDEAALWQKRVSYVLQHAAACQLRTSTNQPLGSAAAVSSASASSSSAAASPAAPAADASLAAQHARHT